MEKGIVIIAYNKEVYYDYAYNLASSIKLNSNCKIQIICDKIIKDKIKENKCYLFDYITDIGDKNYEPGELKTMVYDFSLFNKTIFIDSDSLIFPNINIDWIFYELDKYNFVCANRDQYNLKKDYENTLIFGGKLKDYINHFNLKGNLITNVFSFFMFFKKNEETRNFFNEAKNIYKDLTLNKENLNLIDWQNCVADELAFSLATCKNNFHSDKIGYSPILTDMEGERGMFNHFLACLNMSGKIGMTMPGNEVYPHNIQMYDFISSIISIKKKIKMFTWKNK